MATGTPAAARSFEEFMMASPGLLQASMALLMWRMWHDQYGYYWNPLSVKSDTLSMETTGHLRNYRKKCRNALVKRAQHGKRDHFYWRWDGELKKSGRCSADTNRY